jgi:O-antigen ligase
LHPLNKVSKWKQSVNFILSLQVLFALPVYFSVLMGIPPIWLGRAIMVIPLILRFWLERRFIQRTAFDVPIALFLAGAIIGLIVAPDRQIALGALATILASALIYYGITGNSGVDNRVWLFTSGFICLLTIATIVWFFSQGNGRQFAFNEWAFGLFNWKPKTGITFQMHGLGLVLSVIVPPLLAVSLFHHHLWLRLVSLTIGAIFLFSLVLSDSGTGWLAVIFGLIFVTLVWRLRTVSVIVPVTGITTTVVVAFYSRVRWLSLSLSTVTLLDRVHIWMNTLSLFKGWHFIFGLGLGSWYDLYRSRYNLAVEHTHNSYLQIYADNGILGVVSIIIAYIIFVRITIKILTAPKNRLWYGAAVGLAASIVTGAVFACFDVTTSGIVVTSPKLIYLSVPVLWIWAAFLVVAEKKLTSEIRNPSTT